MKKQASSPQLANRLQNYLNALAEKIKNMTDKPLPWPHTAREARDRAAEELQSIVHLLTPITEGLVNLEETKIKVSKALTHAHVGLRHLEGQGAQTRPD